MIPVCCTEAQRVHGFGGAIPMHSALLVCFRGWKIPFFWKKKGKEWGEEKFSNLKYLSVPACPSPHPPKHEKYH